MHKKSILIQPEWVQLAESVKLTLDNWNSFVWSKQSKEKAFGLVSCGDVFQLSVSKSNDAHLTLNGYVHAELKSNDIYQCSITLQTPDKSYLSHKCPCIGILFYYPFFVFAELQVEVPHWRLGMMQNSSASTLSLFSPQSTPW
jgi:hypothetical protein